MKIELWACDYHGPPERDDDYRIDDERRDDGWREFDRYVPTPSALGEGRTWNRHEEVHICPECLKDPDCLRWLADQGFRDEEGKRVVAE